MASLTDSVPDKVEVLAIVETALAWDLSGSDLPPADVTLGMVEQLTTYGRVVAIALRTMCLSLPAESEARLGAQATLSEAGRRLYLPPPEGTRPAAARRARNVARLVQGLLRATHQVSAEQRSAPHSTPQQAPTKGTLG
ncbi:DUF6415 family natural product biosynthesis protein [Streptomyces sp. NBC_01237]|uniref:DUF6415 family natural product biosynthesis protein n=1 Tax=Streptomyces sp. NBC_01237 TaxID=2903790 RepID=UPI002DDC267C|nr:DUF6415 family natural product biosynthesis protein [Streptomyces sp. NBC_01237]WRZ77636.1 DUF6415 family natural product biosynthesis protein [Streptomyces sp. NBC_01237]